jgi:hypothetical protein
LIAASVLAAQGKLWISVVAVAAAGKGYLGRREARTRLV